MDFFDTILNIVAVIIASVLVGAVPAAIVDFLERDKEDNEKHTGTAFICGAVGYLLLVLQYTLGCT